MNKQPQPRAALIIATALLLLPLLYLGSYFALVIPGPDMRSFRSPGREQQFNYRMGGFRAHTLFWPIEQVDRRLRRSRWEEKGFAI